MTYAAMEACRRFMILRPNNNAFIFDVVSRAGVRSYDSRNVRRTHPAFTEIIALVARGARLRAATTILRTPIGTRRSLCSAPIVNTYRVHGPAGPGTASHLMPVGLRDGVPAAVARRKVRCGWRGSTVCLDYANRVRACASHGILLRPQPSIPSSFQRPAESSGEASRNTCFRSRRHSGRSWPFAKRR